MSDIRGPTQQAIDQARQNYAASLVESAVQGLPPGFITGFVIRMNPDSSVTVGSGIASVANIQVQLTAQNLKTSQETFVRSAAMWAYIFLGRDGLLHVDTITPAWSVTYGDYYHTKQPWRFLGRMWIDATGVTRFAGRGGFSG